MKARYFLIGFILLLVGFFAYHFYAANSAEQTLDETIREITAKSDLGLTISYSSIDVGPFTGDIHFSDINIIRNKDIQRAASASVDLTYSDFLNFMIWGTESGLKKVTSGKLRLNKISYVNRNTRLEVKIDSLRLDYRGNLWNLIVLGVTGRPAQIRHEISADGTKFTFSQPDNGIGIVKADSLHFGTHFGRQPEGIDSLKHTVSLEKITWTPNPLIQEKYRFFIQGFGYQTDSIPFETAYLRYDLALDLNQLTIENMTIDSELFTTSVQGNLMLNSEQITQSTINNITIRIEDMSPRFNNFLTQFKKLTGLQIPGDEDGLTIRLNGPLSEPELVFQP